MKDNQKQAIDQIRWRRSADFALRDFVEKHIEHNPICLVRSSHAGHAGINYSYTCVDPSNAPFIPDMHVSPFLDIKGRANPFFYFTTDLLPCTPDLLLQCYNLLDDFDFLSNFARILQSSIELYTGKPIPNNINVHHFKTSQIVLEYAPLKRIHEASSENIQTLFSVQHSIKTMKELEDNGADHMTQYMTFQFFLTVDHPDVCFDNVSQLHAFWKFMETVYPDLTNSSKNQLENLFNQTINVKLDLTACHILSHPIIGQSPIPTICALKPSGTPEDDTHQNELSWAAPLDEKQIKTNSQALFVKWARSPWSTDSKFDDNGERLLYLHIQELTGGKHVIMPAATHVANEDAAAAIARLVSNGIRVNVESWTEQTYFNDAQAFWDDQDKRPKKSNVLLNKKAFVLKKLKTCNTECQAAYLYLSALVPLPAFECCGPKQVALLMAANNLGITAKALKDILNESQPAPFDKIQCTATLELYSHMLNMAAAKRAQNHALEICSRGNPHKDYNLRFLENLFKMFYKAEKEDLRVISTSRLRFMVDKIAGCAPFDAYFCKHNNTLVHKVNQPFLISRPHEHPTDAETIISSLVGQLVSDERKQLVLLVKSELGTGKSKVLNLIAKMLSQKGPIPILGLTPRRLLADDTVEKSKNDEDLKGYTVMHYKDKEQFSEWDSDSAFLISQLESLGRVSSRLKYFYKWHGILYLDEISALFKQMISTTMHDHLIDVLHAFMQVCLQAKVILATDADINQHVIECLRYILDTPDQTQQAPQGLRQCHNQQIHMIVNEFKKAPYKALVLASNLPPSPLTKHAFASPAVVQKDGKSKQKPPAEVLQDCIIYTLVHEGQLVDQHGPIVLASGSKTVAEGVLEKIKGMKLVTEDQILFIHGDNSAGMRNTVLKDISKAFIGKRLVVFTPAITQGVDVNETKDLESGEITKVFAYRVFLHIESGTCTVKDYLQMVGRARNRVDKNIYITICDRGTCTRVPLRDLYDELGIYLREVGLEADHMYATDLLGSTEDPNIRDQLAHLLDDPRINSKSVVRPWMCYLIAAMRHEDNISRGCLLEVLNGILAQRNGQLVYAYESGTDKGTTLAFHPDLPECFRHDHLYETPVDPKEEKKGRGRKSKKNQEPKENTDEKISLIIKEQMAPLYRDVRDRELHHIEADRQNDPDEEQQRLLAYEQIKYDLKRFFQGCSNDDEIMQQVWVVALKDWGKFKQRLDKSSNLAVAIFMMIDLEQTVGAPLVEQHQLNNLTKQKATALLNIANKLGLTHFYSHAEIDRTTWTSALPHIETLLMNPVFQEDVGRAKLGRSAKVTETVQKALNNILGLHGFTTIKVSGEKTKRPRDKGSRPTGPPLVITYDYSIPLSAYNAFMKQQIQTAIQINDSHMVNVDLDQMEGGLDQPVVKDYQDLKLRRKIWISEWKNGSTFEQA